MNFSIIAALDNNQGIGIKNKLPWNLKADLKHFSEISIGKGNNAVIMGFNTWISLPEKFRPLKNRLNVVLSTEKASLPGNVLNYQSLESALAELEQKKPDEVFIIGGGMLYHYAIKQPECNKLYITEIMSNFKCDTFFPGIPADFIKTDESDLMEENDIQFKFVVYKR